MKTFKEFLNEKAPPGKKAEEWILKNKAKFKDEYGDDWEEVLYATAWKIFGESIETIDIGLNEESTAASTTTGGVENPDAPRLFKKSKFMNVPCLEVDDETFHNLVKGKPPYARWKRYANEKIREELARMYKNNKRLLVKNSKTHSMIFVK